MTAGSVKEAGATDSKGMRRREESKPGPDGGACRPSGCRKPAGWSGRGAGIAAAGAEDRDVTTAGPSRPWTPSRKTPACLPHSEPSCAKVAVNHPAVWGGEGPFCREVAS